MGTGRGALQALGRLAAAAAIIFAVLLAFARWFMVGEIEHGSRGRPGFSADAAEKDGMLVARLPVATPEVPVFGRETLRVTDAWIERRSQLRYSFFLFRHRVPIGGYLLVFAMPHGRAINDLGPGGPAEIMEGDSVPPSGSTSTRDSVAIYREIWEPFPDSLRLRLCEYKFRRDGAPKPHTHAELAPCPQPWLDTMRARH